MSTPNKIEKKKKKRNAKRRIQFEFSAKEAARLKWILDNTEHVSFAEVVRTSLITLEWLVNKVKEGYDIHMIDQQSGEKTQLVTPMLLAVTQQRQSESIPSTPPDNS